MKAPVEKAFDINRYKFEKWLWIKVMQDPRYLESSKSFQIGSVSYQDLKAKAKEIFQEFMEDENSLHEEFLRKPQGK